MTLRRCFYSSWSYLSKRIWRITFVRSWLIIFDEYVGKSDKFIRLSFATNRWWNPHCLHKSRLGCPLPRVCPWIVSVPLRSLCPILFLNFNLKLLYKARLWSHLVVWLCPLLLLNCNLELLFKSRKKLLEWLWDNLSWGWTQGDWGEVWKQSMLQMGMANVSPQRSGSQTCICHLSKRPNL